MHIVAGIIAMGIGALVGGSIAKHGKDSEEFGLSLVGAVILLAGVVSGSALILGGG